MKMFPTQSFALLFLAALAVPPCMSSCEGSCKSHIGDSDHDLDELGALQVHHNSETISERDTAKTAKVLEAEPVKDGDYTYLVPCDDEGHDEGQVVVWPDEPKEEVAWAELQKPGLPGAGPMWSQAGSQIIPRLIPCKHEKDCDGKGPLSVIPCKGNNLERFQNCGEGGRKGSPLQWDLNLAIQNGYTLHNGKSDPHAYFLYTCWGLDTNYYWSRWGRYDHWVINGSKHTSSYPGAHQIMLKVKSYDGVKADTSTVSYGDKIVLYNPAYNDNELSRTPMFDGRYTKEWCKEYNHVNDMTGYPGYNKDCNPPDYLYWYSPNYNAYYKKENTCWKFVKAPPLKAPPCSWAVDKDMCIKKP